MTKPRSTYAQLLLDPRWQRKRLEVLQAADFTCKECGSKENTLHVHHGHYRKGAKPWEYELHELHVLCADCHEALEHHKADLLEAIGRFQSWWELAHLTAFVRAYDARTAYKERHVIPARDYHEVAGVALGLGVSYDEVNEAAAMREDGSVVVENGKIVLPEAPPG